MLKINKNLETVTDFQPIKYIASYYACMISCFSFQFSRFLIIVGQHEESLPNHGYISRHFIRRYLLPDNIETAALESTINNGILTVTAPAAILPSHSGTLLIGHPGEEARAETLEGPASGNTEGGKNIEAKNEKDREEKDNQNKSDKE